MNVRVRIAVLAVMAALISAGGGTLAQERSALSPEELDNATAQVAAQLRCLVCRGQSVLESNSQLAQEMKGVIRDRLAGGESPDDVRAYFVRSYGEYILLRPEARGVSLLVYVLPALALLGGGLLLFRLFGRWTRPAVMAPSESELSSEEQAWLREQLQGK